MQKGFGATVLEGFVSSWNTAVTFVSFLASFALWLLVPEARVSVAIFVPIVSLIVAGCVVATVTMSKAAYLSFQHAQTSYDARKRAETDLQDYKARNGTPRMLQGRPATRHRDIGLACVIDDSELFEVSFMVSFFRVDDGGAHVPLGYGTVINRQPRVQIWTEMIIVIDGEEEFIERLKNNDKAALSRVVIKPNVPTDVLRMNARM